MFDITVDLSVILATVYVITPCHIADTELN